MLQASNSRWQHPSTGWGAEKTQKSGGIFFCEINMTYTFFTHMAQFSNSFGLAIDNFYKNLCFIGCLLKKIKVLITFLSDRNGGRLKVSHTQKNKGFDYLEQRKQTQLLWKGPSIEMLGKSNFMPLLL